MLITDSVPPLATTPVGITGAVTSASTNQVISFLHSFLIHFIMPALFCLSVCCACSPHLLSHGLHRLCLSCSWQHPCQTAGQQRLLCLCCLPVLCHQVVA